MPGGLLQLNAYGSQNLLMNGNPTLSHFKCSYKRHTPFALESITLPFDWAPKQLPDNDLTTIRCKVDRNADCIHDGYLVIPLPRIWSPVHVDGSFATPYEFQWIPHLGFNMIENIQLLINNVKVAELTGEWMKFRAQMDFEAHKRSELLHMVGHRPALIDPGNAHGRFNQYPHAIRPGLGNSATTVNIEPSILGGRLIVPLQFFFCEQPGQVLPLIALQAAKVEIQVTFRSLYDLFTIREVRAGPTRGMRIRPSRDVPEHHIRNFLSEPNVNGSPSQPGTCWFFEPHIEMTYVYLGEDERRQLAVQQNLAYLVKQVRVVEFPYSHSSNHYDVEAFNLVTRMVWVAQRTDAIEDRNEWDNYTNWEYGDQRPFLDTVRVGSNVQNMYDTQSLPSFTAAYASGRLLDNSDPQIVKAGTILLGGKQRLTEKPGEYFEHLQHYKHSQCIPVIPGVYLYSFSLNPTEFQPSGALNASMFDKIGLQLTLQTPPKSTDPALAPSRHSVAVLPGQVLSETQQIDPANVQCVLPTLSISRNIAQVRKHLTLGYAYSFHVRLYIESYNFLKFADGVAALSFAN